MQTIELVNVKFTKEQNEELEKSFMKWYHLDSAPVISKKLVVDKSEHMKFLKSRTRLRTQFEAKEDSIDLSFDWQKIPFEFIATITRFEFPSGKNWTLYEKLDAPCGKTEYVEASCGGQTETFKNDDGKFAYNEAEKFILGEYLIDSKEIK